MMKRILMFSPFFFDYEKKIKEELEKKGYFVKLYSDASREKLTIKERFLYKICRKKSKVLREKEERYFKSILKEEENQNYDFMFVIKGQGVPEWFYEELKKRETAKKWISYQWDDIGNCSEVLERKRYFDKNYSYSEKDSVNYNYKYRPFFFIYDFKYTKTNDIFFIGTGHSDRESVLLKILKELERNFSDKLLKMNINLLIKKSKYVKKMKWMNKNKIYITKKIEYKDVMLEMAKSKITIEIPHDRQFTTTTRAIEAIGTRTKIITTVKEIRNKDFYNENNYLIIDRKNPKITKDWLEKPYVELDEKIRSSYNLSNWIDEIFN
ncbi:MAG: hypothetical protein ACRC3I_06760 [Cetobacterium sp.]